MSCLTIHKLTLDSGKIGEEQEYWLPHGAYILDADWQQGDIAIWYAFKETSFTEKRKFFIAFTNGQPVPFPYFNHIKTLQKDNFVYHVFYDN